MRRQNQRVGIQSFTTRIEEAGSLYIDQNRGEREVAYAPGAGEYVEQDFVENVFHQSLVEANYALNFQPEDRIGISILGETLQGERNVVYLSFQPFNTVTSSTIVNSIGAKLSSAATLRMQFDIVFTRVPAQNYVLRGNEKLFTGNPITFASASRSVVSLCPPHDMVSAAGSCLFQFIVLGLSLVGKIELPFQSFVKGKNRFKNRDRQVQSFLFPEANTQLELLQAIEEEYDVQFVLIEASSAMYPVYPLEIPCLNQKVRIVGLVQRDESNTFTHVDLVQKPSALLGRKNDRWCTICFSFYHSKRYCASEACKKGEGCRTCHLCQDACSSCGTFDCYQSNGEVEDYGRCACGEQFRSVECSILHQCMQKKMCTSCNTPFHPDRKCSERFCNRCFSKYDAQERHTCSLRKKKIKPASDKCVFYDFECIPKKVHIPFLVCARIANQHPELERIQERFPCKMVEGFLVFQFWGIRTCVSDFVDFICSPFFKHYQFIAHNSKSYDLIFLKSELTRRKIFTEDIRHGQKLLWMSIPSLKVSFLDSMNFMASSLRSLAKDFHVPMQKSYFPYMLVDEAYLKEAEEQNGWMPAPSVEDFELDPNDTEALEWIRTHYQEQWNVVEEAVHYCSLDVLVLEQVVNKFRVSVEEMCPTLDAFAYITLQSAIMNYFLAEKLENGRITPIDSYQIEQKLRLHHYVKTLPVGNLVLDQFVHHVVVGNTHFILLDCFQHGCLKHHISTAKSKRNNGKTFGDCAFEVQQAISALEGETCICWNCELPSTGFCVRDAYKGGKSEVYHHYYEGKISMADFVSEYPSVMMGKTTCFLSGEELEWNLPMGEPELRIEPEEVDWTKCGIAQVTVHAPDGFTALLSHKVVSKLTPGSYETIYGLCRICMEERLDGCCSHSELERAFTGTWCYSEIHEALRLGYRVLKVHVALEYAESSSSLFRDFLSPFMIAKMTSKKHGLVEEGLLTDFGRGVCEYVERVYHVSLSASDFVDAPAKRQAAKLIMNAFTGKWGQKEIHTKTQLFYPSQEKECLQLLYRENVELVYVQIVDDEGTVMIQTRDKFGETNGHVSKNDIIIAYITAGGRIMLNRAERACGERLLYVDTDSAYFKKTEQLPFRIGYNPGDLELELEEGDHFAAAARKTYAYLLNGRSKMKQKGVQITWKNASLFGLEQIRDLIYRTKRVLPQLLNPSARIRNQAFEEAQIQTEQRLFKTIDLDGDAKKETVVLKKNIRFNVIARKRVIQWEGANIKTLPFGWRESF